SSSTTDPLKNTSRVPCGCKCSASHCAPPKTKDASPSPPKSLAAVRRAKPPLSSSAWLAPSLPQMKHSKSNSASAVSSPVTRAKKNARNPDSKKPAKPSNTPSGNQTKVARKNEGDLYLVTHPSACYNCFSV